MKPSGPRKLGTSSTSDANERGSDDGPNDPIDRLSREMRDESRANEPPIDWSAVDAKLFDRVRAEIAADEDARRHRSPRAVWLPVAATLAVAAAVALFIGRGHDAAPLDDASAIVATEDQAGALVVREGAGEVLVDGRAASVGTPLSLGSRIETRGARALFEHGAKERKVSFWVEASSRARVANVRGSLVLTLEAGAIEAEVAPVARGEAFAIDVGAAARIAVHGTHLRVARDAANADRIGVDLTEGVVSIGAPPRVGSTFGELVTAPAHAEFAASDVSGTLRVDHAPLAVRPAVSFAIVVQPETASGVEETARPSAGIVARPAPPHSPPLPASVPSAASAAGAVGATPSKAEPAPSATVAAMSSATPPERQPEPVAPNFRERDPRADATIVAAVRACLAERPPGRDVALTVSTLLELKVYDDGTVERARFVPPLAPEVQTCAASVIYKTRFSRGGMISIPIEYKYQR